MSILPALLEFTANSHEKLEQTWRRHRVPLPMGEIDGCESISRNIQQTLACKRTFRHNVAK